MKRLLGTMTAVLLASLYGYAISTDIVGGSWEYEIFLNGNHVGNYIVTTKVSDKDYTISNISKMKIGAVTSTVTMVIVETKAFAPVKCEVTSITDNAGKTTTIESAATFDGGKVKLTAGGQTTQLTLQQPFILDGYYFYVELAKKGFVKDTAVTAKVYNPAIESDKTVSVTAKVLGKEKVSVKGTGKELYHLAFYMEGMKMSDYYVNDNGDAERICQYFMNNTVEMFLK